MQTSCLPFPGPKDRDGYGRVTVRGKNQQGAHRVAWEETFGPIPAGLMVCHHCDNPPCCNPDHLFVGTALDNNRDRDHKGRGGSRCGGETHCPAGHPYNAKNTYVYKYNNGFKRRCRACHNNDSRRRYAKDKFNPRDVAILGGDQSL